MQPIPYPELVSSGVVTGSIIGGILILVAAAAVFYFSKRAKDSVFELIGLILGFMGALLLLLGASPGLHSDDPPSYTQTYRQTEAVQKEIQKSYGVKLSFEEAEELKYPAEAPKAKFKVFGSFEEQKQTEGKAFESRTVYLVWSDGSLGLSESSDGKSFTPLEPKA